MCVVVFICACVNVGAVLSAQEGEEPKAKPPPPDLPPLHISNVLRSNTMEFFGVPRLGAYVAVPFDYTCLTHPDAIPPPGSPNGADAFVWL